MEDLEKLIQLDNEISPIISDYKSIIVDEETRTLSVENNPFKLSLRVDSFDDDKLYKDYIKNCEKLIRMSKEYRLWVDYIKEVLGEYTCRITGEVSSQTKIDIHHHPVCLYLVVKSIISQKISIGIPFSTFDICSDVIDIHYQNKIGFLPILSNLHSKHHEGFLDIPMELVTGDYKYFISHFLHYLEDDELESINNKLSINKSNCSWCNKTHWSKDNYLPVM